jgi:hypothetical protein
MNAIILSNSLTVLADQVRATLEESDAAEKTAIEKALDAGHLLVEAKAACRHGEWLPLLERSGVQERKAQRLMRLAQSGLKSDTVSDLGGIKGALRWAEGLRLPGHNELLLESLNGFTSASEISAAVWKGDQENRYEFAIFGPDFDYIEELKRPIVSPEYVLPLVFLALDNRHSKMSFRTVEEDLSFSFPPFGEWFREVFGTEAAAKVAAAEAEMAALEHAR